MSYSFSKRTKLFDRVIVISTNQIMTSNNFPFPLLVAYIVFFFLTFTLSVVGNTWVILNCWRALKRNKVSLTWCILNLAAADLLFTFLTIFNGIAFLWHWIGGDVLCKLQGFPIETTYTVSITNLVLISYQRLTAITDPLKTRARNILNKEYRKYYFCGELVYSPAHLYFSCIRQESSKKKKKQNAITWHWEVSLERYSTSCMPYFSLFFHCVTWFIHKARYSALCANNELCRGHCKEPKSPGDVTERLPKLF